MRAVFPHACFKSVAVGTTVVLLACVDLGLAVLVAAAICLLRASARPVPTLIRARWLHADPALEPLRAHAGAAERVLMARAEGTLLFAAAPRIDALLPDRPPWPAYLVLDVREVGEIDGSAGAALRHLCDCLEARDGRVVWVARPGTQVFAVLQRIGLAGRGLGETLCFQPEHALERIARDHAEHCDELQRAPSAPRPALEVKAQLRLLRTPLDSAR